MWHPDEGHIHAWLDAALTEDEARELEAHLQQCGDCSERVAEARGLIAAASRIAGALDAVPRGVIPAAAAAPRRPRFWERPAMRLAAALALTVGVSSYLYMNERDSGLTASGSAERVSDAGEVVGGAAGDFVSGAATAPGAPSAVGAVGTGDDGRNTGIAERSRSTKATAESTTVASQQRALTEAQILPRASALADGAAAAAQKTSGAVAGAVSSGVVTITLPGVVSNSAGAVPLEQLAGKISSVQIRGAMLPEGAVALEQFQFTRAAPIASSERMEWNRIEEVLVGCYSLTAESADSSSELTELARGLAPVVVLVPLSYGPLAAADSGNVTGAILAGVVRTQVDPSQQVQQGQQGQQTQGGIQSGGRGGRGGGGGGGRGGGGGGGGRGATASDASVGARSAFTVPPTGALRAPLAVPGWRVVGRDSVELLLAVDSVNVSIVLGGADSLLIGEARAVNNSAAGLVGKVTARKLPCRTPQ